MRTASLRFTASLTAAVVLAACSTATGDAPEPTAEPAAAATEVATSTPEPAQEATTPAVEVPTPEASAGPGGTVEEPAVPTEIGQTVPAALIEAARSAGASVYVSPNGNGDGIVVEPGTTPEALADDVSRADGVAPPTLAEFGDSLAPLSDAGLAARAAETGVFVLIEAPSYTSDGLTATRYVVEGFGAIEGVPEDANYIRDTKEAAIAAIQPLMEANPGYAFIDLLG